MGACVLSESKTPRNKDDETLMAFVTVLSYIHDCSYDSQETQTAQFLEWTRLLLYCNRMSLKDLLKEVFMFRDKY